jgi:hypothetical protein|tara:strand:+ start:271 stop:474 length:204 start_codon:yes stop_codon:yes gene_type:complete
MEERQAGQEKRILFRDGMTSGHRKILFEPVPPNLQVDQLERPIWTALQDQRATAISVGTFWNLKWLF